MTSPPSRSKTDERRVCNEKNTADQPRRSVVGVGGVGSPLLRNAVAGLGCARRRSVVDDRYIYNDFYNRPAAKDEIADATGKYWKGSGE